MRIAAIDCGTNSIHMIVVRIRPDLSFEVIDREKEMVRLGAGIACVPACTVRAELAAKSLVALKLGAALPALEIRYGHLAALSGVARQFVSAIRAGH